MSWITDSFVDQTINTSKCKPLSGGSYIKLSKELNHPRKGLINIQNINVNECFKWCLIRYLHLADHNPPRIRKIEKDFARKLDLKDKISHQS